MEIVFLTVTIFAVSVSGQFTFCNFDHELCGYINDPSAPMTWEQYDGNSHGHGHVQVIGSGPAEDHTHEGGHGHGWFVQSDCANNLAGDVARLVSPELMGSGVLDFYYTMNGGDLDLSVYILQGGQEVQVWNAQDIDNPFWIHGTLPLNPPNFNQPYQIVFETVRGTDPLCHVAIDDVNINIVAIPEPPTAAATTTEAVVTTLPPTAQPETAGPTDAAPATTVPQPSTTRAPTAGPPTAGPLLPLTTKPVTDKPTTIPELPTTPEPTTIKPTTVPDPTTTMPITPEPTTPEPPTTPPPGMTVTCNSDVIQVVILKSVANLNEQNTHLIDPTCPATINATHIVFETPLDGCGTTRQETENYIIYSNAVEERVNIGGSEITFGSFDFHCAISREILVSGVFRPFQGKMGRLDHMARLDYDPFAFGEYNSEMKFYQTSSYQTEVASPVDVAVGDTMYVEARLMTSDSNLRIRATRCMVTTTTDPDSHPQYLIVDNKCPTDGNVVEMPSPSPAVERFSMKAFQFLSAAGSPHHLHCYLLVCNASAPSSPCEDTCARSGRKARRDAPISELREVHVAGVEIAGGSFVSDDVRLSVEMPAKNAKPSLFYFGAAAVAGAVGVLALIGTALVVRRYRKSRHPTSYVALATDDIDM
ncbi:CUZD1 [Branchiostoma lanceolatum]|uniref:CUZD1 protein n=1 Tax=Branchiostoma lanceolatum TaxID=7740 RepID=A0A8K0E3M7_BRALA|nr:CUZD1 [Branchiostoma lanceolatum]